MRITAFLPPLLRPPPRARLRYARRFSMHPLACTQLTPSTDLRNSAQFLRQHWRNAIANTSHARCQVAIDATAGRGSDTITLGEYLGAHGTVHAYDIQQSAIDETRARYEHAARGRRMARLRCHNASHEDFAGVSLGEGSVSVVSYNLGWYPGREADRSIVTAVGTTLKSLDCAEGLVAVGGVISVMAYVGHPGGKEEEEAVVEWSSKLCKKKWSVVLITYPNRGKAPSLLLCERIS